MTSPLLAFESFWKNRSLIRNLSIRELQRTYKGSFLGILWLVLQPLTLLVVYGFVFGFVLQARFNLESEESEFSYAISLFAGLIAFQVFSECLTRSPTLIVGNTNFVKKIPFPIEVLSITILAAALFRAILSLGILLIFHLALYGYLNWTLVYLPLVLLPLAMLSLGISWALSAIGVYVRDLTQIVGIVATATLFLSAIFYPLSLIPEQFHVYMYSNPMTSIVEFMRLVAIDGEVPPWRHFALLVLFCFAIMLLGFYCFQSLRRGFADVL